MNEFKRSLLIVLIAGAMSTYSFGMGLLPGQEDVERAEALAKEKAAAVASTIVSPAPSATSAVSQPTPEHLRLPTEAVLSGEVPLAPREKSVLETIVHPSAGSSDSLLPTAQKAIPAPDLTRERSDSQSLQSPREFVDVSDGRSPEGSVIKNVPLPGAGRQSATADEFAAAQAAVRRNAAAKSAVAKSASSDASVEIKVIPDADSVLEKSMAVPRDPSGSVEHAIFDARSAKPTSLIPLATSAPVQDPAAGVSLSPAPEVRPTITFAVPEAIKDASGEKPAPRSGSPVHDGSSSTSLSSAVPASAPVSAVDKPVDPLVQKDSLLKKIKRNKLKTFALILALAEAADFTQAFLLKTTKEELQDRTFMQKAKLVAQKTYTAKLLGAAKDTALNLKQHLKTFLNKKN